MIACRAYEEIPGIKGESESCEIVQGVRREPVAAYPISSHFDIKRNYNAATGEQTNVIAENTNDRPWHERDYIRVDWKNSKLNPMSFSSLAGGGSASTSYFVQGHESHPDAMRFVDAQGTRVDFDRLDTVANHAAQGWAGKIDYFDMVGSFQLEPETVSISYGGSSMEVPLCFFISYGGRNHQPPAVGHRRSRFAPHMRVGDRNFEPVPLDDREMAKFGYFRTERFNWDQRYGFTESGRVYLANVFNIWEHAYETDATGKAGGRRKWSLSPSRWRTVSRRPSPTTLTQTTRAKWSRPPTVATSWNTSFRQAVAVAKGLITETKGEADEEMAKIPLGAVPNMFKVNLNGWVQKDPAKRLADNRPDFSCENLEYDESKVEFQLGDLRYNALVWVPDRRVRAPSVTGHPHRIETGEIISGMAYVYGSALDTWANRALEVVEYGLTTT